MSRRRWITAPVVALILVLVAAVVVRGALTPDPRFVACGGSDPTKRILATFALARASDFWMHFPGAHGAPELDTDEQAFVVVFDGPTKVIGTTTAVLNNVVCVQKAPTEMYPDGEVLVYYDVPFDGFKP